MPVSPADFALWARATGNKYPETAEEKIAAAPHAYNYAKSLGRTGANAPGPRVGGSIFYHQPESVENTAQNSVFNAPVTPDNAIPKVAGTADSTLTSEHFINQEQVETEDRNRQHNLIKTVGKVALAAGLTAAGVALASNPEAQQAIRSAGSSIKQSASDIGSRVSSFLGGFGGGNTPDPDVIRNTGDVTPPTTGQRFQQEQVPSATQVAQVVTNDPNKARVLQSVLEKRPISGSEPEYQPDIPHPASLRGAEYEDTFRFVPKDLAAAQLAISRGQENPLAGKPLVDPFTGEIRNPELSIPGYKETFASNPMQSEAITSSQTFRPATQKVTPHADPWTGEYTAVQKKPDASSFLSHQVSKITDPWFNSLESEQTSAMLPSVESAPPEPAQPMRARRMSDIPESHQHAYNIVAAAAERGHKVDFNRALAIAEGTAGPLSHEEIQAYQPGERVALSGQSFDPGTKQTGQMMELRTGASARERAEDLVERYTRENISGLTPAGRQSAGAQRLRGVEERDEPHAVLSTPTGRAMRGVGALDPEALATGEERHAEWTSQIAGQTDPEQLAQTIASATSSKRMGQLNQLLAPGSSNVMLQVRTEQGVKPMGKGFVREQLKRIADNVFRRAAEYHANQQGVELPHSHDPLTGKLNPDYLVAANSVLYGNELTAGTAVKQMGKAFDNELRARGINLAATSDPSSTDLGAVHTFMGIIRGTTTGQLAMEHFHKMSGRATARGLLRSETSPVPVGIPLRTTGAETAATQQQETPTRSRISLSQIAASMEERGKPRRMRYQPEIPEENVSTWYHGQPSTQTRLTVQPTRPQFVGTEAPRSSLSRDIYTGRPIEFLGLYKTSLL